MRQSNHNEFAMERAIKEHFGVVATVSQMIALKVSVSRTAEATLFLTDKKLLYLYIHAQSKLLFGDIKKIVSRMGLKAELYLPPKGQPKYFNKIGKAKFREVFPGRKHVSDEDIIFYKTLVPYNPALVLISEVKDGVVYCYDSDASSNWRPAVKFAYRRIKTS